MENKNQPDIPKYLNDLVQPTPSSIAKLLAAWSGLTSETQILILSKLDEIRVTGFLVPQIMKVIAKALDSDNAYVRYLAAQKLTIYSYYDLDEDELGTLKEKIENDPVPLVKYSPLETSDAIADDSFEDADSFFALPQEARLAKVRLLGGFGDGEKIAVLLSQAAEKHLKDGTVSEVEIYEILSDYLVKPKFKKHYKTDTLSYDGYAEFSKGKDIESLWKLVPKLPNSVSLILIENLPEASGLSSGIPDDVINAMTDHQLATLLYRKDIGLGELRKKLFWEAGEERDEIKTAAVCYHFQLEYDEFAKILKKPSKERVDILRNLGIMANDLNLCFYDAIHDALCASDVNLSDYEMAEFANINLEREIKELKGWIREKELTELRLYRLANSVIPWDSKKEGYTPSGALEFLSEKIVPDDTWATFMAFSEAWAKTPSRAKDLDKYLPRIYEIDEDDTPQEKLEQSREHAAELKTDIHQEIAGIYSELKALKLGLNSQRIIMYFVVGLMIWLLFTIIY